MASKNPFSPKDTSNLFFHLQLHPLPSVSLQCFLPRRLSEYTVLIYVSLAFIHALLFIQNALASILPGKDLLILQVLIHSVVSINPSLTYSGFPCSQSSLYLFLIEYSDRIFHQIVLQLLSFPSPDLGYIMLYTHCLAGKCSISIFESVNEYIKF